MKYKTAVWKEENWFVGHCLELGIATQGGSLDELLENMTEAIALQLQDPQSCYWSLFKPSQEAQIHEIEIPNDA